MIERIQGRPEDYAACKWWKCFILKQYWSSEWHKEVWEASEQLEGCPAADCSWYVCSKLEQAPRRDHKAVFVFNCSALRHDIYCKWYIKSVSALW
jgi:hypothetical protein